jgi:phage baseplate assembly protein gpV
MSENAQLQEILDRLRNRFYGKYRGTVTDVDASNMAIKAQVPAVLGTVSSGWCQPCVPYAGPQVGFCMLPDIGSGVWIEFEGGDVSSPIWTGCYWITSDIPSSADAAVKSIITQAGTLAFDNNAGSVTATGLQNQTLVLDASGITATAGSGSVAISASGVSLNTGAMVVSP